MNRMNRKGFTLIELMVVIIIIGLLSASAVPNFVKTIRKARDKDLTVCGRLLRDAMQLYKMENGKWPSSMDVQSLSPLSEQGYINANQILQKLKDQRLDAYWTDGGERFSIFFTDAHTLIQYRLSQDGLYRKESGWHKIL